MSHMEGEGSGVAPGIRWKLQAEERCRTQRDDSFWASSARTCSGAHLPWAVRSPGFVFWRRDHSLGFLPCVCLSYPSGFVWVCVCDLYLNVHVLQLIIFSYYFIFHCLTREYARSHMQRFHHCYSSKISVNKLNI